MSLSALAETASTHALDIFGTLAARPEDDVGEGTIVLLGPKEPGFWDHVTDAPEFRDGRADPLDGWSERVIGQIASAVGGQALFPFGDPVRPFFTWALRSGRAWQSPVMLLVHDVAGLMVSYRGAVILTQPHRPEPAGERPCESCQDRPCLTACPAGALTGAGYDLDACHAFLDTDAGQENLSRGCAVRRACPWSRNYGRSEEQSAFHMDHFHPCP